jgi:hypothetical protein
MKNQVLGRHYSTGPSSSISHSSSEDKADGRSAIGDKEGFNATKKDVSGMEALFPDNPARRNASKKGGESKSGVKKANESDVSPGDTSKLTID